MALLDIQRRFRELGRIRSGTKAQSKNGKSYPTKLSEWRLTSASQELLNVAAEVYGGTVQVWKDAPTQGDQYELLTGTDRFDVLVPPGEPLSQYWELWSGGGCERRCNGLQEQLSGEPCLCPSDIAQRAELAKSGQACKATTRLSVILPRIPDIGVWRVESHGMNAAVELPGTVSIIHAAISQGQMLPAQLRLEQRTSKKDGETRHFAVPVLELPTVTMAQLQGGEVPQQIAAPQQRAIQAAPSEAEIASGGGRVGEDEAAPASAKDVGGAGSRPDGPAMVGSENPAPVPASNTLTVEQVAEAFEIPAFKSKAVESMARSLEVEAQAKGMSADDLAAVVEEVTGVRHLSELGNTKAGPDLFRAISEWAR